MYILGIFSKEIAVIFLPLILVAYDICFHRRLPISSVIKANLRYYSGYIIICGMFGILHVLMLEQFTGTLLSNENINRVSGGQSGNYLSVIYTAIIALPYYIKLLFLPYNLCLDYTLSTPESIFDPRVTFSFMVLIILILATILTYRYNTNTTRIISFGLVWFLINWLPISNIIPLSNFFIAERYMYIPSLGFCIILGLLINKLYNYRQKIGLFITIVIVLIYSGLTIQRNFDYKSEYTIWSSTVKQNPRSTRAYINLGIAYTRDGKHDKAIEQYLKVLEINPEHANAHDSLGIAYLEKGLYDKAIAEFKKVIELKPEHINAYNNLGIAYEKKGEYKKAIHLFKKVINFKPTECKDAFMRDYARVRAYNNLGVIYEKMREYRKALRYYHKTIEINPDYAKGYENLARLYATVEKDLDKAIKFAKKAVQLNPTHFNFSNLACLYYKQGMLKEAEKNIKKAIALSPSNKVYMKILHKITHVDKK
jgi:tetratricopeptide (TPR) repeat protein